MISLCLNCTVLLSSTRAAVKMNRDSSIASKSICFVRACILMATLLAGATAASSRIDVISTFASSGTGVGYVNMRGEKEHQLFEGPPAINARNIQVIDHSGHIHGHDDHDEDQEDLNLEEGM